MWLSVRNTFIHVAPEVAIQRRAHSCPPELDIDGALTLARKREERARIRTPGPQSKTKGSTKAARKKQEEEDFELIIAQYQEIRLEELETLWCQFALRVANNLPAVAVCQYGEMRRLWQLWAQVSRRLVDQQEGITTLQCALRGLAAVHETVESMLQRLRAALSKHLFMEILSVLCLDPQDEVLMKQCGTVRERAGRIEVWCCDDLLEERPIIKLLNAIEQTGRVRAACAFSLYIVSEAWQRIVFRSPPFSHLAWGEGVHRPHWF